MRPEVLVAYVTRSGSTQEVAETMARILAEAGVSAEATLMPEVRSISEETTVILGAALYVGHLPKEFHSFVTRFKLELSNVRPWVLILGPTKNDPKHFASAEEQARKELAKYPWLHPADVRVLGGKFDPRHLKLSFPFSILMKCPGNPMNKLPPSDIRDWELIRLWTKAIADRVQAHV